MCVLLLLVWISWLLFGFYLVGCKILVIVQEFGGIIGGISLLCIFVCICKHFTLTCTTATNSGIVFLKVIFGSNNEC
jgi:hypothetical protein